jgi:hypothetical protein
MLLLIGSQLFELRIAAEIPLLLLRREIEMLAQPFSRWRGRIGPHLPGRHRRTLLLIIVVFSLVLLVAGESGQRQRGHKDQNASELASHFHLFVSRM